MLLPPPHYYKQCNTNMIEILFEFISGVFTLVVLLGFVALMGMGAVQIAESNKRVWNGEGTLLDFIILSGGFD